IFTPESGPETSPANARGVANVDCTNSSLDQVALIAECCASSADNIDTALSFLEVIDNKINLENLCAATPITPEQVAAGYTIGVPGRYCLTGNSVGTIIIQSSFVTLDLNSFNISSINQTETNAVISLETDPQCVTIQNGSIGSQESAMNGIDCGADCVA